MSVRRLLFYIERLVLVVTSGMRSLHQGYEYFPIERWFQSSSHDGRFAQTRLLKMSSRQSRPNTKTCRKRNHILLLRITQHPPQNQPTHLSNISISFSNYLFYKKSDTLSDDTSGGRLSRYTFEVYSWQIRVLLMMMHRTTILCLLSGTYEVVLS